MPFLKITSLYTAVLVLFYVFLSFFVIFKRWKLKIIIGDQQNSEMIKSIRAHGNFYEYVPLALIILALCELNGLTVNWLHGLGLSLLIGRISHAYGIVHYKGINLFRAMGMNATFFTLLYGAGFLVYKYFTT